MKLFLVIAALFLFVIAVLADFTSISHEHALVAAGLACWAASTLAPPRV